MPRKTTPKANTPSRRTPSSKPATGKSVARKPAATKPGAPKPGAPKPTRGQSDTRRPAARKPAGRRPSIDEDDESMPVARRPRAPTPPRGSDTRKPSARKPIGRRSSVEDAEEGRPAARKSGAARPGVGRGRAGARAPVNADKKPGGRRVAPPPSSAPERIQKVLAQAGFGSRREIETWISEGKIEINGVIATLGDHVSTSDKVRISGKTIPLASLTAKTSSRVLIYHKPIGEICTRDDPEGRPTVFTRLPRLRGARWIVVGRLDVNSSGLLLFTTDGELAQRLMHPRHEIEREYAVRVFGDVDSDMKDRLKTGVNLEDGPAKFNSIVDVGGTGRNHWYHVVIKEGRNREVRRMWESQGVTVSRLIRVRFAHVTMPKGLREGQFTEMDAADVATLKDL